MTPSPPSLPEVLTLAEAAELLRVSVEGLKADLDAGRLPGRTVAGEWRCGRAALLAWLDNPEPAKSGDLRRVDWEAYKTEETPEEQEAFLELLARDRREHDKVARAAERKAEKTRTAAEKA